MLIGWGVDRLRVPLLCSAACVFFFSGLQSVLEAETEAEAESHTADAIEVQVLFSRPLCPLSNSVLHAVRAAAAAAVPTSDRR